MASGGTIKKYQSGGIIFKEGEASGSAYVIVKGGVDLTKNSKHGAVLLAKLKAGELFGEMGIIDTSPRSATARAVGATTLKEIQPDALLKGIQNDPDLSSKVMSKLVERLRTADAMLAKAGVSQGDLGTTRKPARLGATSKAKKQGFFSRFFNPQKGREKTFEILIADFFDDQDQKTTIHYYETLQKRIEQASGGLINVRRTESAFAMTEFADSPMVWGQMQSNAQRWLQELEGDLLIWGQVRGNGETVHMRQLPIHSLRHDRAGLIRPCDAVDLPAELDDILGAYFYGVTVGGLIPTNKDQRDALDVTLEAALEGVRPAMKKKMRDFNPDEQVRFDIGFANLLATSGVVKKNAKRLEEAEEVYMKTTRALRRSKSPLLAGIIQRHLGYTQTAWYDYGGESNLLEAAIEAFREACNSFTKQDYAIEWAALQSMIGQLLFKRDQVKDNSDALKESISACQNALQVFTASSTPQRWGEAKHHLARALQLLGSQSGDLDLIARSAEACREALAVRSKSHTPMLWAATQNNLGSALFMLCQKTKKPETAAAAVKAFRSALDVYEVRKVAKLAKVTQKNLARAESVAIDLGPVREKETPVEEGFEEAAFDEADETASDGPDLGEKE